MPVLRQPVPSTVGERPGARGRPVLLATLDVPFNPDATRFAVDAAVESGQALLVANVTELPPMPLSVITRYDALEYPPELEQSLAAPAELAHSLGIQVERLRVKSMHPVPALLELVRERRPGVLVFGPDRARLRARTYRRAVEAIRQHANCLLWLAP